MQLIWSSYLENTFKVRRLEIYGFHNSYQSYIVFADVPNFKWEIQTTGPILVITEIQEETNLQEMDINVGTEMYFLDFLSLEIYEAYKINKIQFTRYLGSFHK